MRTASAIVLLLLASGRAPGQTTTQPWQPRPPSTNPLGDGRILQRDLSILAPEVRPRDFAAEARYRNAVVTGSAVGGVSFRGSVGYTDPLSFRGALGSEDLFEFRRDSAISGLAGSGIRGTDALQYQFALTTGGVTPIGLAGSLMVQRGLTDYAARGGLIRRTEGQVDSFTGVGALGISQAPQAAAGTLRSASSYLAGRSLIPGMVGYRIDPVTGKSEPVAASPILGVQWWGLTEAERTRGQRQPLPSASPAGSSATTPADLSRPRTIFDELRQRLMGELGVPAETQAPPAQGPTPPSPGGLGTATPPTDAETRARDAMLALRNRLLGVADATQADAARGLSLVKTMLLAPEEQGLGQSRRPGTWSEEEREVIEAIRETGTTTLSTLAGRGLDSSDAFAIHLAAGQRYLAEGRYFDAEERFARALVIRPADQACLVGRLHAQLGAAMILSASLNLRELFTEYPEAIPVRYAPELLPSPQRQAALIELLRDSIAQNSMPRQAGLLLAYLGYQRGERALVEEGLAAFARVSIPAEPTQAEAQEARATMELAALLRRLWLDQQDQP